MKLKVLSEQDCEQVRLWRNECLESLRTPFPLTKEQQAEFYHNTVCNRAARARYWGIHMDPYEKCPDGELIGMCGIENIEQENRRGEISIIMDPQCRGEGHGTQAVELLLEQGFMYLNLENIWGEVYENNPAIEFWKKIIKKYSPDYEPIWLDCMKYYNGQYWDGLWFNVEKIDYLKATKPTMGACADTVIFDECCGEEKNEHIWII